MSTRFLLAQLIERRIESIQRDAKQLCDSMSDMERSGWARSIEVGLNVARRAAASICTLLEELSEGETKQDDLPNLAEKIGD